MLHWVYGGKDYGSMCGAYPLWLTGLNFIMALKSEIFSAKAEWTPGR
jgi:hypothetical protein